MYFLAMETTKRRLASVSSFLACSASASPRRISCSVRLSSVKSDLAGDSDLSQFRAARAQFLARFGGSLALGGVGAALEPAGLALERMQPLDGVADLVDQPLLFDWVELD